MKTLTTLTALSLAAPLVTSLAAQAQEIECLGLDEAPASNPRLRFEITIDYQKIGHLAGQEIWLKREDGTSYLALKKGEAVTVMASKDPNMTMLYKGSQDRYAITYSLHCNPSKTE